MLPNFLVIGASRSGTTSLFHYLDQHPDVFICPIKETNFFLGEDRPSHPHPLMKYSAFRQWAADIESYEKLFTGAKSERAVGEVCSFYLQTRSAPRAIHRTLDDPKLIAILRQPVDRAYASFMGLRRDGRASGTDFRTNVLAEFARGLPEANALDNHVAIGRYHHWLRGYYELFPRERIGVWLFDDFKADATAVLQEMFSFLGVDDSFVPDTTRKHNPTGLIRNPVRRFLWTKSDRLRWWLRPHLPRGIRDLAQPLLAQDVAKQPLDPEVLAELTELYRDDIEQLGHLIERDLSHWLV